MAALLPVAVRQEGKLNPEPQNPKPKPARGEDSALLAARALAGRCRSERRRAPVPVAPVTVPPRATAAASPPSRSARVAPARPRAAASAAGPWARAWAALAGAGIPWINRSPNLDPAAAAAPWRELCAPERVRPGVRARPQVSPVFPRVPLLVLRASPELPCFLLVRPRPWQAARSLGGSTPERPAPAQ